MKHPLLACALLGTACLAQGSGPASLIPTASRPAETWKYTRIGDLEGVKAVTRISDRMIRGAQPDDLVGMNSLKKLGVKTILAVEEPDLKEIEAAKAAGIEIKNVPTEYSGLPKPVIESLIGAYRDLEGITYVHCHHGKHRGGAAVAIFRMTFEGFSSDEAIGELFELGCSPRYTGLYDTIAKYRPDPALCHRVPKAVAGLSNLIEVTPRLFRATGKIDEASLRAAKELGVTRVVVMNGDAEMEAKVRAASLECKILTVSAAMSAADTVAAKAALEPIDQPKTLVLGADLTGPTAAIAGWRIARSKWTLDEAAKEVEALLGKDGATLATAVRAIKLAK